MENAVLHHLEEVPINTVWGETLSILRESYSTYK